MHLSVRNVGYLVLIYNIRQMQVVPFSKSLGMTVGYRNRSKVLSKFLYEMELRFHFPVHDSKTRGVFYHKNPSSL